MEKVIMVLILRIVGWFGIVVSAINGGFKLFADNENSLRYAGPGRDLDINLSIMAFCLIFLALASILSEVKKFVSELKPR
jgi:hypothetical protein